MLPVLQSNSHQTKGGPIVATLSALDLTHYAVITGAPICGDVRATDFRLGIPRWS